MALACALTLGSLCGGLRNRLLLRAKSSISPKLYDTTPAGDELSFSVINGNDISCGQKDTKGDPVSFCQVCKGRDAVENACNKNPRCVAYDYNLKTQCGYLKSAKGPLAKDPKQETYTMWQYPKSGPLRPLLSPLDAKPCGLTRLLTTDLGRGKEPYCSGNDASHAFGSFVLCSVGGACAE